MKLVSFYAKAKLELRDPAGMPMLMPDGRRMYIHVRGEDAPEYQKVRGAYLRKISKRGYQSNPGDAEEYEIAVAAALTDPDWLIAGEDGKEVPYSPEVAHELYRDNTWLATDVNRFGLERASFLMPRSAS
jgi:hypothetical protein